MKQNLNKRRKLYTIFKVLILAMALLVSCKNKTNKHNIAYRPIDISKRNIKDLDSISALILRNKETLIDSAHNHYDYYPAKDSSNRYKVFYFTRPWMMELYLPEKENIHMDFLRRHSFEYGHLAESFIIEKIDFRPSDSSVIYQIQYSTIADTVVLHFITNNDSLYKNYKYLDKINKKWSYFIVTYFNDELM